MKKRYLYGLPLGLIMLTGQVFAAPATCSYVFSAQQSTHFPIAFVFYDVNAKVITNIRLDTPTDRKTISAAGCRAAITATLGGGRYNMQLTAPNCSNVFFNGNNYCAIKYMSGNAQPIDPRIGNWAPISSPLK